MLIPFEKLRSSPLRRYSFHLVKYFANEENLKVVNYLASVCEIETLQENIGKFSGKSIVFTGTLQTMTRQQAKIRAEELGFKVLTEISSKTDYLVYGEKAGSKLKKAEELGVKLLTEEEWIREIE